MYQIRHYDKHIHPDHFKRGVLGWVIRMLNLLRWKLEVYNQGLVVKYLLQEGAVDKPKQREIRKLFEIDCAKERIEKKETSPDVDKGEAEVPRVPRSERYREGAIGSSLAEAGGAGPQGLPVRPGSISDLLARYGSEPRAKRYARGKRHLVYEEFEPVGPEAEGEADGESRRSGTD